MQTLEWKTKGELIDNEYYLVIGETDAYGLYPKYFIGKYTEGNPSCFVYVTNIWSSNYFLDVRDATAWALLDDPRDIKKALFKDLEE